MLYLRFDVEIEQLEYGRFEAAVAPESGSVYNIPAGDLGSVTTAIGKYLCDYVADKQQEG